MKPSLTKHRFSKGDVIFEEGKLATACYLVTLGRVRIVKSRDTKQEKILGVVEAGDIIGEMALLGNRKHLATAIAITPLETTIMSKEEFDQRVANMDPIVKAAVQTMAGRSKQLADMLVGEDDKGQGRWTPVS